VGVIDAAAVDARRRAGFQSCRAEGQRAQALGQLVRGWIARASASVVIQPHVDAPTEERAHGEHHRRRAELDAGDGQHSTHAVVLDDQVRALLLEQREVGLVLERAPHEGLVELAVRLHARGAHRRTLAGIERA
jgi:hypothetical protein